jgi:hypothetical protein
MIYLILNVFILVSTYEYFVFTAPVFLFLFACFFFRGGFYPERIRFVLGTAGFLLSCLPSLFDFGMIRS